MRKQGGNEIACQPIALLATRPDASGGKRFEFRSADRAARSWAAKMRSSGPRNAASETDFGGEIVKS